MEALLLQLGQQGIIDTRKENGQWIVYIPSSGIVISDSPANAFAATIQCRAFRTNPLIYERLSNGNLRTLILANDQSPVSQSYPAQEMRAILSRELQRRELSKPRARTAKILPMDTKAYQAKEVRRRQL